MSRAAEEIANWQDSGRWVETDNGRVFVRDVPANAPDGSPPLLVLHGFPTSSFDFRHVVDDFAQSRRVVLFDQLGFGLSDKPDRPYGIHLHADTAEAVISELGLDQVDLLTHDMGDSVGGELLARDLEGRSTASYRRRVITNGSIYLGLAQLTEGQKLLSSLPDELTGPIPAENFSGGFAATFSEAHPASAEEREAAGLLGGHNGGLRLMARLIRYLEDRRREEDRYTGAIERHPAPLHIIWGVRDPIAVVEMSARLASRRPDATLTLLDDVGHYPMVEVPAEFSRAVLTALGSLGGGSELPE